MTSPIRPKRITVELTPGMWVAAFVVLGIGALDAVSTSTNETQSVRQRSLFGLKTKPVFHRVNDRVSIGPSLTIELASTPSIRVYQLDPQPADSLISPTSIGQPLYRACFVDASRNATGELTVIETTQLRWPPDRHSFSDARVFLSSVNHVLPQPAEEFGFKRDVPAWDRRLTKTIADYSNCRIEWLCPVQAAVWPFRAHWGKCELGSRVVLISVVELSADSTPTDYSVPPFSVLADGIVSED